MSHITTQSPELESPQPSKSLTSARFIKPHAESTLHAIFISTVSEETWSTTTQPTALQTLKIMMKVVNPVWEPPKRGALGRLVQESVQCRHGEEWRQPACTSEQGGETGCTQRQQGRCHLTAEIQEGKGSPFILQESSPLWFPYLHDLKCSFLKHHGKGAASLARPRLGTWDTANISSLPRLCLMKGTEVVTPSASLSNQSSQIHQWWTWSEEQAEYTEWRRAFVDPWVECKRKVEMPVPKPGQSV